MSKIYRNLIQKSNNIKKFIYKNILSLKNVFNIPLGFKQSIGLLKNKIIYPIRVIKTLHQRLLQTDQETLTKVYDINVYGMLWQWLLDVMQFGFICSISYIAFIGYPGTGRIILMLFGFGMIPSIIIHVRNVIINGELK